MSSNSLLESLILFVRREARHFDVHQEDRVAYNMLRMALYELAAASPTSAPVFDLALFASMSCECQRIIALHRRYRELEGRPKMLAHKDFVELLLKARYRFSTGRAGFSIMCTFALLTNVRYIVAFEDPVTLDPAKLHFCATGVYRMERLFDEEARKRREREETHVICLRHGAYYRVRGEALAETPAEAGIDVNYERWLRYCRTVRSAIELPQAGEADTLTSVVALLMFFETA